MWPTLGRDQTTTTSYHHAASPLTNGTDTERKANGGGGGGGGGGGTNRILSQLTASSSVADGDADADEDELDAGSVHSGGGGALSARSAKLSTALAAGAGGGSGDAGTDADDLDGGGGGGDDDGPELSPQQLAELRAMYIGHYNYPSSPSGPLVLEGESRLSHSMIWNWMRAFYDQSGVTAWSNNIVPNFVTSNNYIASLYARFMLGVIRDCFGHSTASASASGAAAASPVAGNGPASVSMRIDVRHPIYVIELGAGHGKFSFLLLKKLMALREFMPACSTGSFPFKYVMTDFTESNINFWKQHPSFQPFIKAGLVDFAVLDCEVDTSIRLHIAGIRLSRANVHNPMILVANYIFDTLRHDAFRMVDGVLHEALITVCSERTSEPDLNDPTLIKRFKHKWTYKPCSTDYYTGAAADLNPVLKRMASRPALRNSSILMPVGGLACMRHFLSLSGGRLIVLSGDKAYNHEVEYAGHRDPHIAVHGSFSMMVNYDAVRHYVESVGAAMAAAATATATASSALASAAPLDSKSAPTSIASTANPHANSNGAAAATAAAGAKPSAASDNSGAGAAAVEGRGFSLHTPHFDGFKVSCFVAGARRSELPDTRLAFHDITRFGPDEFSTLQRAMKDDCPAPSLKHVISMIRLSGHDSDVFFKLKQFLIDRVSYPHVTDKQQRDIKVDIETVANYYYPLSKLKDVSFEIGRLYMSMKDYPTAIRYFLSSVAECGDHHVTQYNLGLCHHYLGETESAYLRFTASVDASPDYHEAREWQARMKVQMKSFRLGSFVPAGTLVAGGIIPPGALAASAASVLPPQQPQTLRSG